MLCNSSNNDEFLKSSGNPGLGMGFSRVPDGRTRGLFGTWATTATDENVFLQVGVSRIPRTIAYTKMRYALIDSKKGTS